MKALALLLALLPAAAAATTITVNTIEDTLIAGDGRCSLREATANVNAAADTTGGDCAAGSGTGDSITFSVHGTIRRNAMLGALVVQRDVSITAPSTTALRITGAGKSRVFEIAAGTTQMAGVSIVSGAADHGAGILVDGGASLLLADCAVRSNKATASGGGIYNDGGTIGLTNCQLSRNQASNAAGDGKGGGMYNAGDATLSDCTLSFDTARGVGSFGGGIYNTGMLNIARSKFKRNTAIGPSYNSSAILPGGGGFCNAGTAIVTDTTFSGNRASNSGGGINNSGTLELRNCTSSANRATFAGGLIAEEDSTTNLNNTTLSGNRSRNEGGGILGEASFPQLTNCTVRGNHAGAHSIEGGIGGYATLINTIIARNTAGAGGNCGPSIIHDGGHNIDDGATCPLSGAGCANGSGSSFCNTNPHLDPAGLKDNGGPTQTIALCTGPGTPAGCTGASLAIDAGDDSVTGPPDNLTTDQRGLPRLSGAHVDIGAYEVQQ